MADIKRKPVIYNFGKEGRDACWTALKKSLDHMAQIQTKCKY